MVRLIFIAVTGYNIMFYVANENGGRTALGFNKMYKYFIFIGLYDLCLHILDARSTIRDESSPTRCPQIVFIYFGAQRSRVDKAV